MNLNLAYKKIQSAPWLQQTLAAIALSLLLSYFFIHKMDHLVYGLIALCGMGVLVLLPRNLWLYLFVINLPFFATIPLGVDVPATLLFLLLLGATLIFEKTYLQQTQNTPIIWPEVLFLASCVVIMLSILRSVHIPLDWKADQYSFYEKPFLRSAILSVHLCSCFLSAILIQRLLTSWKQFHNVLALFIGSTTIVALASLYCYAGVSMGIVPYPSFFPFLLAKSSMMADTFILQRLQGFCQEPALAGRFFTATLFIGLIYLKKYPKLIILSSIALLFCILLTFSRSAWLVLAIAGGVFITLHLWFHKWRNVLIITILSLIGFTVALLIFLYPINDTVRSFLDVMIVNNFQTSEDFAIKDVSASIRLSNIIFTKRIFAEFPFWGVGVGNMPFHSHLHHVYVYYISEYMGTITNAIGNSYAQYLIETGLVGLTLLLLSFASILGLILIKIFQEKKPEQRHLYICIFCMSLAIILHSLFFSFRFYSFWFFIALALFCIRQPLSQK